MNWKKDNGMGRFSVEIELVNNDDVVRAASGDLPKDQVRRATVRGIVDTGATRLVVPEATAKQLGLQTVGQADVRYANGPTARRPIGGWIHLTCQSRSNVFDAVLEPNRDTALIGAIVLEALDFVVDCNTQSLVPRDPERIVSEVE
jgi:predicted aspartyl protease